MGVCSSGLMMMSHSTRFVVLLCFRPTDIPIVHTLDTTYKIGAGPENNKYYGAFADLKLT